MGLKDAWRWLTAGPDLEQQRSGLVWPYPSDPFGVGGSGYFSTSRTGIADRELPAFGFTKFVDLMFRANPIIFACELKRISVFSEARFVYRGFNKGRPGKIWSNAGLDILEHPWERGTTSDLLAEILIMADIGGNAFITRSGTEPDRLRVLRPDFVTIVMGDASGRPVESHNQLDAEVIGFIYDPQDGQTEPEALLADEVAHFIPPGLRDPLSRFRGMSWLTPVLRDFMADQAATMHKLAFFEQGATPQLVVTMDATVTEEQFEAFVGKMDQTHNGWRQAYKTLYLGGGAQVTPIGKDLQQLDFSNTQGKGEVRIAIASGVHPVLVPLSEGMQGSSLNHGNYAEVRRVTADTLFRPLWRNLCGSLAQIIPPPGGSELWYDELSIPFLREDNADAANIMAVQSSTVATLVKEGFTAESAKAAVDAQDVMLLEHTGLMSVQLQPPGMTTPDPTAPALPAGNGSGGPKMPSGQPRTPSSAPPTPSVSKQ